MDILGSFLSGDPKKVWLASNAIRELRDEDELRKISEHLKKIRKETKHVFKDGGPGLLSNSYHLNFALEKLRFIKEAAGCQCELYPNNMFFNPNKEADKGFVVITDKLEDAQNWTADYKCECTSCGNKFHVHQGEYHYTWYDWTNLNPRVRHTSETLLQKVFKYVKGRL
ncbi:hypothetical protein IT893_11985 [Thalassospira sp. A40-3]|uniref:hypothetical protein n=1 Tax=Thalassospira sp. A40-3 TaxID=2785908 RepID=UPI0018CED414|nr:hypothetical protein [Thalassospira sp. A40-3]QPO10499.1 hypothetical protein IT893_11985 [Thalassospira sp. A40-3]